MYIIQLLEKPEIEPGAASYNGKAGGWAERWETLGVFYLIIFCTTRIFLPCKYVTFMIKTLLLDSRGY